jgi:hypothetical protein
MLYGENLARARPARRPEPGSSAALTYVAAAVRNTLTGKRPDAEIYQGFVAAYRFQRSAGAVT